MMGSHCRFLSKLLRRDRKFDGEVGADRSATIVTFS
jgi:hypothetical protein